MSDVSEIFKKLVSDYIAAGWIVYDSKNASHVELIENRNLTPAGSKAVAIDFIMSSALGMVELMGDCKEVKGGDDEAPRRGGLDQPQTDSESVFK